MCSIMSLRLCQSRSQPLMLAIPSPAVLRFERVVEADHVFEIGEAVLFRLAHDAGLDQVKNDVPHVLPAPEPPVIENAPRHGPEPLESQLLQGLEQFPPVDVAPAVQVRQPVVQGLPDELEGLRLISIVLLSNRFDNL